MRPNDSFVEQPVRSLQTMLRVLSEDDPRLPSVIPDGIYGPSTTQAVAAFQRNNGLPSTGITEQETWDMIVQKYKLAVTRVSKAQPIEVLIESGQEFKLGDSSPYIYLLQSMLTQLAHDHVLISSPPHSGVMDEGTKISLEEFQRLSDLPVTGNLDRISWKNLVLQFTLNAHANFVQK